MNATYDAVVVGAGYIGCSVAYHLASAGLRTALLDRATVGAGASGANYGNVQVQDAELKWSLPMTVAGYQRCERLEEELGCSVGYRRKGCLLIIESESQWRTVADRLPALNAAGIHPELVPREQLPELEPLLECRDLRGACYNPHEGQVDPFKFLWAYVRRGLQCGLDLHVHTEVTGFDVMGGRVQGLQTNRGTFSSHVVVLTSGPWTPQLGKTLGRNWHIPHQYEQVMVTEPSELRLNNYLVSAAFFEEVEKEATPDRDSAILAITQTAEGHFLLGSAGGVVESLDNHATPAGLVSLAAMTRRYLPTVSRLRVRRGWAAPVAFSVDGVPFLGPVVGIEGLILATAFGPTVVITPLIGTTIAQLVTTGRTDLDLAPFSPDREIAVVH